MASAFLSPRHPPLLHPSTSSTLPSCSLPSPIRPTGRIVYPERARVLNVSSTSGAGRREFLQPERNGFGSFSHSLNRLGFNKGLQLGQQQQQRWKQSFKSSRNVFGSVSCYSKPSGFKKGLGLGHQEGIWKQIRITVGERSRIHRNSATQKGSNFLGKGEEPKDPESKNVSVPIIGELPISQKELSMFTPMKLLVWLVLGTLASSIASFIMSKTIFNPWMWHYSSWILVKWPWPAAVLVGIGTLVTAFKSSKRQPKEWEQVFLLLGTLTWLILVPHGIFNGFVDGWPLVSYILYSGFFLISAVVRYRLYGDLTSKDQDKQWETYPSRLWQIGFILCVVAGHWVAAYEAPFLPYTWNLEWKTIVAIFTLALSVVTHYTASYFLGKYFDRLVRPKAVVMFGPYRFVRHPIYASYMLLFAGYSLALRSYKSLLFIITACVFYYEQRTKLEEGMLADFFGEIYQSYRDRVKHKYFPLIY